MKKETVQIAIADDHTLFRAGLARIIQSRKNFNVVIEALNGQQLLEMIADSEILPDICITDIEMHPMNGYETAKNISRLYPSVKIMALSMHREEYCVINMIRNGARGFITKDAEPATILNGIQQLEDTGFYYPDIEADVIGIALRPGFEKDELNDKELQFLSLCCSDMKYKDIADKMNVSERSIDSYRDGLFRKLQIRTRSGLVMFAMLTGLKT